MTRTPDNQAIIDSLVASGALKNDPGEDAKPIDKMQVVAHNLVRERCESWRSSLLINGSKDGLHSHECRRAHERLAVLFATNVLQWSEEKAFGVPPPGSPERGGSP